eukprot:scaffold638_cov168-Amphora_coffeaeformis.AAC.7
MASSLTSLGSPDDLGSSTRSIDLLDGRTKVSYVCIPPASAPETSSNTTTAVVHFGNLSGCSAATLPWTDAWQSFCKTASLITVDRPGCHETSPVQEETASTAGNEDKDTQEDWVLQRMRVNTRNVLAVLQAEKIDTVYILAVCLGHPYAIHFAREILLHHSKTIQLKGISLVAPFVSTACSRTWFLARLGNSVPSFLLSSATDLMISMGATLIPYFLKPSKIRGLLSEDEQADWKDPEDYEHMCRMITSTMPFTQSVQALEARFGSSTAWQQVIDDFALVAGYGLKTDNKAESNNNIKNKYEGPFLFPRIKIHASPGDRMVSTAAIEWLAERCYATAEIVMHPEVSSHTAMTFWGGPPRSPRLLQEICQREFGL